MIHDWNNAVVVVAVVCDDGDENDGDAVGLHHSGNGNHHLSNGFYQYYLFLSEALLVPVSVMLRVVTDMTTDKYTLNRHSSLSPFARNNDAIISTSTAILVRILSTNRKEVVVARSIYLAPRNLPTKIRRKNSGLESFCAYVIRHTSDKTQTSDPTYRYFIQQQQSAFLI
jgi:hypothetical protein